MVTATFAGFPIDIVMSDEPSEEAMALRMGMMVRDRRAILRLQRIRKVESQMNRDQCIQGEGQDA